MQVRAAAGRIRRHPQAHRVALLLILLLAFVLRTWNINWDQDQHLHPDERFWNIITDAVEGPTGISDYFDSADTSLNPYQHNPTFVYGTGPLVLTKASATWLRDGVVSGSVPASQVARLIDLAGVDLVESSQPTFDADYQSHVVGRLWSAIFDTGTVLLAYVIGRRLFSTGVGLLSALFVATAALHIQYSHFYGAETIATFFVTLTVLGALHLHRHPFDWRWTAISGIGFGLAVATKLNSVGAVVAIVVALALARPEQETERPLPRQPGLWPRFDRMLVVGLLSLLTYRIVQPYAFVGGFDLTLDARWTEDIRRLSEIQSGIEFPPNVQWVDRIPVLFPLSQLAQWGFGPAATIAAIAGLFVTVRQLIRRQRSDLAVVVAVIAAMVLMVATRRTPTLRYLLPIYPLLAVMAARGVAVIWEAGRNRLRQLRWVAVGLVAVAALWGLAFTAGVYGQTHSRIAASEWIVENIPPGSTVSVQAWDDGLPLYTPAAAGFPVNRRTLEPFGASHPDAVRAFVEGLDEIDYVIESSNRVYDSVSRIPARYTAMITYYEALDSGALGFERVAEFTNAPGLFGLSIDDADSEEAFTVYDHPTVTIWQKTGSYSTDRALALLDPDRSRSSIFVIPRDADANALMLDAEAYQAQQSGGTYTEVFERGIAGWPPWFWWFVFLQLSAFAVLPIVASVFGRFGSAAVGMSKPLGLLAVVVPVWLIVSWGFAEVSRGLILTVWLALLATGGLLWRRRRTALVEAFRANRTAWITAELVFVGVFVVMLLVRASNPDLWHPFRGGEKPMEMAYLTAVTRSSVLPPYDPWLAGGSLNYFYFGFFVLAIPMRLLGVAPEIGFNLGLATYAAFSAAAIHAVASSMAGRRASDRRRAATGVAGVVLLLIAGNLAIPRQQLTRLREAGRGGALSDTPVIGWIVDVLQGTWTWIRGDQLAPIDWWSASRVNEGLLDITEFPAWSFVFGDLHPHVIGITMMLLTLAVALVYVRATPEGDRRRRFAAIVGLGVTVGLSRMTNTWDFAASVLLVVTAVGVGHALVDDTWRRRLRGTAVDLVIFGAAHVLFLWPYLDHSQVFNAGLDGAQFTTPLDGWITQFGLFTAIAVAYLALHARRALRDPDLGFEGSMGWQLLISCGIVAIAIGTSIAVVAALSTVLVFAFIALAVLELRRGEALPAMVAVLYTFGYGITAGVDIVTITADIQRMNTVFKFWYQAWTLFSVASAVAVVVVIQALRSWHPDLGPRADLARRVGLRVVATTLVVVMAAFPLLAVRPRLADRFAPLERQLDGLAYLRAEPTWFADTGPVPIGDDLVLIEWLRDKVEGSPTIVEAVGPEYQWAGRMSIYTGLPTVAGWGNHQRQQRGIFAGEIDRRRAAVSAFWSTTSTSEMASFLRAYDVSFIVVGTEELRTANPITLDLFETVRGVSPVFAEGRYRIYEIDKRELRGLPPDAPLGPFVADESHRSGEDVAAAVTVGGAD